SAIPQSTQQFQSVTRRSVIPGSAETAEGCPVTASDASFVLLEHSAAEHRFEVVQNQVKLHNVSSRAIRRVHVGFEFEYPEGGLTRGRHRMDEGLAENESRIFTATNMSYKTNSIRSVGYFAARVLAVEFADGARWIVPRSFDPIPLNICLSQQSSVVFANCKSIDPSYQATLRFHSDKVLAYRLGVVKDTMDSYEVRLGEWVNLPRPPAKGSEIEIQATDENPSLAPDKIFLLEPHLFQRKHGVARDRKGGVALFVAEVKFTDGKDWIQSLKREDLIWDN
ncbi:MAG: hypothetical protein ABI977_35045, partial [Acidobacteriota bacterium]